MSRTMRRKRPRFWRSLKGRVPDGSDQYISRSCRHHGGCSWCRNGRVHTHRRRAPLNDRHLLNLLSIDIDRRPQRLQQIDESLVHRVRSLLGSFDVDLDRPL